MNASRTEPWSIGRSLALLAATFAIVLGTLLPFAAMAAAVPGQPVVLCSVEGPKTVQAGGATEDHPHHGLAAECAACVAPLAAALPPPPLEPRVTLVAARAPALMAPARERHPPARGPPRPYSTAPPHA